MTARKRNRKRSEDSAPYLRADMPLRAVRVLQLSEEFKRAALRGLLWTLSVLAGLWAAYGIVLQAPPFRVNAGPDGLRLEGLSSLPAEHFVRVFAGDFGRSLARVDVTERLRQIRGMPWVRSARVTRVWPNTVVVAIEERVPVAFLRVQGADAVRLIDGDGVILAPLEGDERSLPVLVGIDEGMPFEERIERIQLFDDVMEAFAATGGGLSEAVSEIDVSAPDNAVVFTLHGDEMVKLQMGDRYLQHRLDVFLKYIESWREEFGPVEAVDLRFEKQVAVKPASGKRRQQG